MELVNKSGWIEVICGPMFAGKSEELIRRLKRLEYAKKRTIVFKPALDNRYSENEVVSHIKRKYQAIPIKKAQDIWAHINSDIYAVAIDEVQFFDEEILQIVEKLANLGKRVILAGLDQDFKGQSFPIMAQLMAMAEYVDKLTAICVVCGAPATKSQRIVNGEIASEDDPIIIVGASESYEPRCRHCHKVRRR